MQFIALFIAFFAALAGRAYAQINATTFNITLPGLGNVTANQFLSFNDADLTTKCSGNLTAANNAISACTNNNATCLCSPPTVRLILECEQCYFEQLIAENRAMPDVRAGNAAALTAYATACNASAGVVLIADQTTLTLPSNWDGPYGQFLNAGATVFGVICTIVLGVGAITVVNTM
ncbi:hypothetical protein NM688_g8128 [Phlebia brevispora]|uniref:Uncharacterized protein n=1 Tax=Phlebia brevispora TaxID=194682 RepID=A0ACC1RWW1_9APHY|nr:hypothetical protein NM688_g8128 [Phlebia brevispora]